MAIEGIGFLIGGISGFVRMPNGVDMTEAIPAGAGVKDLKAELGKFGITCHIVDVEPPNLVAFRVPREQADKARWVIQRWMKGAEHV